MSVKDAHKLALWLSINPPRRINLIGGEPFLNKHLVEIVRIFRDHCPSSFLTIFTGGLVNKKSLMQLKPDDVDGILININEERDYPSPQAFARVNQFIQTALVAGFRINFGFNIWRLDFDPVFMPSFAYSFGRQGFRWTVANPNLAGNNKVIEPSQFRKLSKSVVQMLRHCTSRGLTANLDCPLPICFFDQDDLAWIAAYHPHIPANLGSCSPPIDITPELEAMRCFSLSTMPRTPIDQHASAKELHKWFLKNHDDELLSRRGIFEECRDCSHFLSGRCQGGCFGWRDLNQLGYRPSLHRLYKFIQEREYEHVIEELESISRWFLTPLMLYLGAIAAYRLGDQGLVWRYAARGLDHTTDVNLRNRFLELFSLLGH